MDIVASVRASLNRALEPAGVTLDAEQYARPCGPVLFQRFFAREPVSDHLIEELVTAWSAARPGSGSGRG